MYIVIVILILVVCVLLAAVVLIQNSKGGGLAANFGGGNQYMGVRKTTDFLEKATWVLAAILIVFSILATALVRSQRPTNKTELSTEVSVDNSNYTQLPSNTTEAPVAAEEAPAAQE